MKDLMQMVMIGAVLAGLLLLVASPYRIHGDSMLPTLRNGQLVIIEKISFRLRAPRPGEVVVACAPMGVEVVKRVIKETPDGKFWLEGDNKEASTDSREFGALDRSALKGRVIGK